MASGAVLAVKERVGRAVGRVGRGDAPVSVGVEEVARRAARADSVDDVVVAVVNKLDHRDAFAVLDQEVLGALGAGLDVAVGEAVGEQLGRLHRDALLGGAVQVKVARTCRAIPVLVEEGAVRLGRQRARSARQVVVTCRITEDALIFGVALQATLLTCLNRQAQDHDANDDVFYHS